MYIFVFTYRTQKRVSGEINFVHLFSHPDRYPPDWWPTFAPDDPAECRRLIIEAEKEMTVSLALIIARSLGAIHCGFHEEYESKASNRRWMVSSQLHLCFVFFLWEENLSTSSLSTSSKIC